MRPIERFIEKNIKYIFVLPAVLFVGIMIVFPIGYTLYLSFFEWSMSGVQKPVWVFMDNYKHLLFDDERFWAAFGRTFYFTIAAMMFELVLGIAIAVLFNRKFRGKNLVKTLFLLPMVSTPVAIGLVWLLIFEPTIGFGNQFLKFLGLEPLLWIASPDQAIPSLVLVDVWQWTPMISLILLAGLATLPQENYEAAEIDGANVWQMFWRITLPLLMPTIFAAGLLRAIDALKTFDIIYAMTQGGPGFATETLNIYGFQLGFQYFQLGMTSAMLMLFFLLVLGISLLIIQWRRRLEVLN
ncbi:carbohydrate ABC transporter permease [Paenibacillus naphthalenovorans]|uniref:Sugar ABC transporter permease n=1 Tax=Paenibacillus naphthalenovorans TaxID=162209 RepID=A0A0U2W3W8_9BACL|nr:sugar ABC transporter permease [Paenibacillus naphthalenovorans]ALS21182.1 sugar ABC transporter permease [Paenibacillus naphthalenovorans]